MRHLIEPCDVDKYARPCDMDDEIIARAIEEAELLDIKPKLGDELFMRLLTHVQFAVLLNGGEYTDEAIEAYAKAYCKDSMDKYSYDGIDVD